MKLQNSQNFQAVFSLTGACIILKGLISSFLGSLKNQFCHKKVNVRIAIGERELT